MIRAQDLTLRRGTKVLLDNAEFVINPGERVGIVGKNGAGKSSLFAVLQGSIDIDAGNIDIPNDWRIASVEQIIQDQQRPAREFVIDGDHNLRALEHERAHAEGGDGTRIAELETKLLEADAWSAPSRAEQLLAGLGFAPTDWMRSVHEFSGGWQMRIALARALMAPSDLLLLDEPTNHLDLDAMLWLERWISSYTGTVLIISHDTEFLDATARHILHFDHQKLVRYRGRYQDFLTQRAERLRQHQLAHDKQQREAARLQGFIDRFKAKASKAKQAQSRVKALARMQALAPLHTDSGIHIRIPEPDALPDPLLTLNKTTIGYETPMTRRVVISELNLMVRGGDRIGILGVNGAGKSSLIKTLSNQLAPLSGQVRASKGLEIGYFAQHQLDMLDLESTPLQHLTRIAPQAREHELRTYLGGFGFSGDMVNTLVKPMSGGEKARLALSLIVWRKPNLLLLDEPSNHLDVDTREALAAALAEFGGSVLLVSHDRHLLRTTVDQFWVVANGQVTEFNGDLDDYRSWLADQHAQKRAETSQKARDNTASNTETNRREQRRADAQLRQERATQRRPLERRLEKLERDMDACTTKLQDLDQVISDPDLYAGHRRDERIQTLAKHGELVKKQQSFEEEWLKIQEQLESLSVT